MRTLALTAALTLSLAGCEDVDYVPPHAAGAVAHWVETDDGAWIHFSRYAHEGGEPVILCHGISSNHHFWDLEPGRSLALFLYAAGYDVWNMDLRGHGPARHDPDGKRQRAGWTVDDYGLHDLPAAFAYVQEHAGGQRLRYVGHSLGGMVLAVYLANTQETPLERVVVVGSPLDFRDADQLTRSVLRSSWMAAATPFIPTPTGARLLAQLDERTPLALDEMLYNPANMTVDSRKRMLARIVSPLSRGEIAQLGLTKRDGEFHSHDGSVVYREELGHVTVPMRFIAGRADHIASPDRVRAYYDAVGSAEKDFIVASVANGFHGDYGHLDLGLGDYAAVDVYPLVAEWLAR